MFQPSRSIPRQIHGVTLVEMTLTVMLLGVLLAACMPSMNQLRQRQRLTGVAQTLMTDLQQARSESVQRADIVQFRFSRHDSGTCYVVHSGKPGDCQCERGGQVSCVASARSLRVQWFPAGQTAAIRANVGNMSFQPRQGMVSPAGSIDMVAENGQAIRHIVSITGRVRSCALQGEFGNLPPCRA